MAERINEPEILLNKRISEEVERVLNDQNISSDFRKELESYKSEEHIPFRLVKRVYENLKQSGD